MKRSSNLADRRVNRGLDLHEHIRSPQPLDDLAPRDKLPMAFDQKDQQIHRLTLESDGASVVAQFVRGEIENEITKAKGRARIGGHDHPPLEPT
jgi:hypothetical protein